MAGPAVTVVVVPEFRGSEAVVAGQLIFIAEHGTATKNRAFARRAALLSQTRQANPSTLRACT